MKASRPAVSAWWAEWAPAQRGHALTWQACHQRRPVLCDERHGGGGHPRHQLQPVAVAEQQLACNRGAGPQHAGLGPAGSQGATAGEWPDGRWCATPGCCCPPQQYAVPLRESTPPKGMEPLPPHKHALSAHSMPNSTIQRRTPLPPSAPAHRRPPVTSSNSRQPRLQTSEAGPTPWRRRRS